MIFLYDFYYADFYYLLFFPPMRMRFLRL